MRIAQRVVARNPETGSPIPSKEEIKINKIAVATIASAAFVAILFIWRKIND